MKQLKKNFILLFLVITMFGTLVVTPISAKETQVNGFSYDDSIYNATFTDKYRTISTFDSDNNCIGKMHYKLGRLRNKKKNKNKTYQDTIVIRMVMDPQRNPDKKRFGCSEYLEVTALLPTSQINDWSPQNQPNSSTWNIGFSATSDKIASISASTNVTKKQLDFESDVQINKKKMRMVYDYKPDKSYIWSSTRNKYVRNSSVQYAMVTFDANKYSSIQFNFKANFTYSMEKKCQPIYIEFGSNKGKGKYKWEL